MPRVCLVPWSNVPPRTFEFDLSLRDRRYRWIIASGVEMYLNCCVLVLRTIAPATVRNGPMKTFGPPILGKGFEFGPLFNAIDQFALVPRKQGENGRFLGGQRAGRKREEAHVRIPFGANATRWRGTLNNTPCLPFYLYCPTVRK